MVDQRQDTVTVICLTRHGHGTTGVVLDNLLSMMSPPLRIILVDIGSPPPIASQLHAFASRSGTIEYLRFENFVSRQQARLKALESVKTTYTLILDNNVLLHPEAIDRLLATAAATKAAIVSPTVVTLGGSIHYSGGEVIRRRQFKNFLRTDTVLNQHRASPVLTNLANADMKSMEVDFVESHCALALTDELRRPGVLEENMHNAHTMCYASYRLKHVHAGTIYFEPLAIASIVPIGFGYDIPWMLSEYMRLDRLQLAYTTLGTLVGQGLASDFSDRRRWHTKHFKYLALDMVASGRLHHDALLDARELPDRVKGYDAPLPPDIEIRVGGPLGEYVMLNYPSLTDPLNDWLNSPHDE